RGSALTSSRLCLLGDLRVQPLAIWFGRSLCIQQPGPKSQGGLGCGQFSKIPRDSHNIVNFPHHTSNSNPINLKMNKQAFPNFTPGNNSFYGLSARYQDFDPTCTPSRTQIANYHNDITSASTGGYEPPCQIMIKKLKTISPQLCSSRTACQPPKRHQKICEDTITRSTTKAPFSVIISKFNRLVMISNCIIQIKLNWGLLRFSMEPVNPHYNLLTHKGYSQATAVTTASYALNDIQQAFEHPLHHHIGHGVTGTIDTIAVLQLDVAIDILHGNKSPGDQQPFFQVDRFKNPSHSVDFVDWQDFCDSNMKAQNSEVHDFDIVIGPVCSPSKGNKPVMCLQMKNSKIQMTQSGFCSKRSGV
ncbi:hypothetical protein MJO28_005141, partial [Puccinia striiformis f. sp. tritici]